MTTASGWCLVADHGSCSRAECDCECHGFEVRPLSKVHPFLTSGAPASSMTWTFTCSEADCFYHVGAASVAEAWAHKFQHRHRVTGGRIGTMKSPMEQLWEAIDEVVASIATAPPEEVPAAKARAAGLASAVQILMPEHFPTVRDVSIEAGRRASLRSKDIVPVTVGVWHRP